MKNRLVRRSCWNAAFMFLLTSLLAVSLHAQPINSIPEVLYAHGASPTWVALRAISLDPDGSPDLSKVGAVARKQLELYMARSRVEQVRVGAVQAEGISKVSPNAEESAEAPCPLIAMEPIVEWPDGRNAESLDNLRSGSVAIVIGEVVAVDQGFFRGSAASMLRVRTTNILRASPLLDMRHDLYVYFPSARFSLGRELFCSRPRAQMFIPAVGDGIVIHVLHPWGDRGSNLVVGDSKQYLFERDGVLHAPQSFRAELAALGIESISEFSDFINAGTEGVEVRR